VPTGRAALVVGASGGIGAPLASMLASEGYSLTVAGRNKETLAVLQKTLSTSAVRVESVVADLTESGSADRVVTSHLSTFGRLDVLVLASGITRREALADTRLEGSRRVIDVNFTATLAIVRAAIPALREAGRERGGALVVLLGSIVARQPAAEFGVYSATKAAVASLARSVNEEEGRNGVRATTLSPGFVDTEMARPIREMSGEDLLPVDDLVEGVRFLLHLSPLARVEELEIGRIGVSGRAP
jgi:3-oxoacyl-[acyl-carrier protein] reductase